MKHSRLYDDPDRLSEELANLPAQGPERLKERWRILYGTEPPPRISEDLLKDARSPTGSKSARSESTCSSRNYLAQDREGLPRAFIPTEFLDSSEPVLAEPLSKRWVVRDQPYIFRDVGRVIGIAIERGIATDLAQRRNSRRHNGTAVSHCLQRGEAKALVERGEEQTNRTAVKAG